MRDNTYRELTSANYPYEICRNNTNPYEIWRNYTNHFTMTYVVRCKDCKYYENVKNTNRYWCSRLDGLSSPNAKDYCSHGEARYE